MDDYIYMCMHIHVYIYMSRVFKKNEFCVCNEKMCKWMITYICMRIYIHIYICM